MSQEVFFKISTSNETVKNQIKEKIKNSLQALSEYIWNAIDSKAKNIEININLSGNTLQSLKITDDGSGINYDEIQKSLFKFLSDTPKAKIHKEYLTLPHGKYGTGRFSFVQFAHQVNWNTTYKNGEGNFNYEIAIESNSLNNVQKIKDKEKTHKETGTEVKISRIDASQDLIKNEKNPLESIRNYLFQEFYQVMRLYGIKISLNKQEIKINDIIKKEYKKKIKIKDNEFEMTLVNWEKDFCNDFSYHFLNEGGEEIYHKKSSISKYDSKFLHSCYITGKLFNDFCPASELRKNDSKQESLFDKEKFEIYSKLIEITNNFINKTREPFNEQFAKLEVDSLDKKGYFDKILKSKLDKEFKKPIIKETTTAVIKFAPKIIERLNKEQTLVFLNLINKLMDDDKDTLLDILKILLNTENEESLLDLKNILEKYKVGGVISLIHEIEKRLQIIQKIDLMHHNDNNKEYSEDQLQEILNDNFWIFGDNYSSLICSEEDDFTKMRNIYIKEILKEDPNNFKDKVSQKQVDLFIHGFVEIDKLNKNLIVEIKKPSIKLSKEIYNEQLLEYAEIIRKRPEFNDPTKHEWHFLLVGHDFKDDFFEVRYQKKQEYLMEEIESANIKLYVMRWTDIISDLRLKYNFLKEKLNLRKEKLMKAKSKDTS
ncbi:MAG: ATP-binding protein [Candidatus Pacearchaeota archaeon]